MPINLISYTAYVSLIIYPLSLSPCSHALTSIMYSSCVKASVLLMLRLVTLQLLQYCYSMYHSIDQKAFSLTPCLLSVSLHPTEKYCMHTSNLVRRHKCLVHFNNSNPGFNYIAIRLEWSCGDFIVPAFHFQRKFRKMLWYRLAYGSLFQLHVARRPICEWNNSYVYVCRC